MHNSNDLKSVKETLQNYWDYYEWKEMRCQIYVGFQSLTKQKGFYSDIKTFQKNQTLKMISLTLR